MSTDPETLTRVCREILAPLIEHDRGELYLVRVDQKTLALHLAGRCSGCPGVRFTTSGIIEPAIRAVAPEIELTVTTGCRIPRGASRLPAGQDRQSETSATTTSSSWPGPAEPHPG